MGFHDFQCKCGRIQEVFYPAGLVEDFISCDCGRTAERVWLKAPGVAGDIEPYYDVQLGCQINSKQQRERIAKERGKVLLGPDEFRRTNNTLHAETVDHEADQRKFREAMEKAWSDVKNGNVPKTKPKTTPDDAVIVNPGGGE